MLINIYSYFDLNLRTVKLNLPIYIKRTIKNNKSLICYRTPQSIIYNLILLLPMAYISYYFSLADAGFYALARTALVLPATILGKSITDVLYPKVVNSIHTKSSIKYYLNKFTLYLVVLNLIPLIILYLCGDKIFGLAFGEKWEVAGSYAIWIYMWVFMFLINKPYSAVITSFKLESYFLINTVYGFILLLVALLIISFCQLDIVEAVAIISIFTALPQLMIVFYVGAKIKIYEIGLLKNN